MRQRPFVTVLLLACLSGAASRHLLGLQAPSSPRPRASRGSSSPAHYWPLALGRTQQSASDNVLPFPLERALNWSWHHPLGRYATTISGGPVIDFEKNLYLAAPDGIRKFSPDGKTHWWYQSPGDAGTEPSLLGDSVFGNTQNGFAFAIDRHTGKELWVKKVGKDSGHDVGYPGAHGGMYIMATESGRAGDPDGGNSKIIGLKAKSGEKIWEYRTAWPSWNFMPIFALDDTFLFMDFTGGIYRLGLRNGTEIWHRRAPDDAPPLGHSFSDGGMVLGTNRVAYTCSQPGLYHGQEGTPGVLRAYTLRNGELAWSRTLPQPCNSWPAVGRLGYGPKLSVVVTPGSFMGSGPVMHGSIMAFDAASGDLQWKWQAPPYSHNMRMAMGDLEGMEERHKHFPGHEICLPAHWSVPHILGDRSVIAGRSDGILYKLKGPTEASADEDAPKPGIFKKIRTAMKETSPGVVLQDRFDAQGASLHGAMAMAPGMFAFSTCTDNMFVFRY